MKSIKTGLLLLIIAAGLMLSSQPAQAQDCVVQLGFKTLRDLIPDIVGECLAITSSHDPDTGFTRGKQTTNGFALLAQGRQRGPAFHGRRAHHGRRDTFGLTVRKDCEVQPVDHQGRFPWEVPQLPRDAEAHLLTLEQLRNGGIPSAAARRRGEPRFDLRTVRDQSSSARARLSRCGPGLIDDIAAFGDLDR